MLWAVIEHPNFRSIRTFIILFTMSIATEQQHVISRLLYCWEGVEKWVDSLFQDQALDDIYKLRLNGGFTGHDDSIQSYQEVCWFSFQRHSICVTHNAVSILRPSSPKVFWMLFQHRRAAVAEVVVFSKTPLAVNTMNYKFKCSLVFQLSTIECANTR